MIIERIKSMEFDGDIIITDPCYITKDRDTTDYPKWNDYMSRESYAEKDLIAEGLTQQQIKDIMENEYRPQYEEFRKATSIWNKTHPDDWEVCWYGERMNKLGIKHALTNRTIYGDWSCTTFEDKTNKALGKFCADAGMVGVFLLSEVLAYNPQFNYHIDKPWTTTLIKDFKGLVYIERTKISKEYYDRIRVIGEGINKVTGLPLCFHTEQTGL